MTIIRVENLDTRGVQYFKNITIMCKKMAFNYGNVCNRFSQSGSNYLIVDDYRISKEQLIT